MSAQSPEMVAQIALWREQIRSGTMTQEEYAKVIASLRADRAKVTQATAGSKVSRARTAAAKKPDAEDLLTRFE